MGIGRQLAVRPGAMAKIPLAAVCPTCGRIRCWGFVRIRVTPRCDGAGEVDGIRFEQHWYGACERRKTTAAACCSWLFFIFQTNFVLFKV